MFGKGIRDGPCAGAKSTQAMQFGCSILFQQLLLSGLTGSSCSANIWLSVY